MVLSLLQHLTNGSERLVVVGSEEVQAMALLADSCCPTTAVDINLGVERALVVEHVADIWDIETSCSDVGAHENGRFLTVTTLDVSHSSFEPI